MIGCLIGEIWKEVLYVRCGIQNERKSRGRCPMREFCLAEKYDVDMDNYRSYVKEMSVEPCEICGYPEK
ncbi:MAG: hypothetical protein ACOCSL_03590 [Thermoplasmatota archaeon]